jgi:hypothetical protein
VMFDRFVVTSFKMSDYYTALRNLESLLDRVLVACFEMLSEYSFKQFAKSCESFSLQLETLSRFQFLANSSPLQY